MNGYLVSQIKIKPWFDDLPWRPMRRRHPRWSG